MNASTTNFQGLVATGTVAFTDLGWPSVVRIDRDRGFTCNHAAPATKRNTHAKAIYGASRRPPEGLS